MKEAFVTDMGIAGPFIEEIDRPRTNGNTLKDNTNTSNNKAKERIEKLERMLKVNV
jgi:hypothetical protein